MIYFRHKETWFVVSHKDLKERYQEVTGEGNVIFHRYEGLVKHDYIYKISDIPFNDDFEILEVDESLKSEDYIRLINILENSIITDKELIEKIRPIIHNKIRIELLLNNF